MSRVSEYLRPATLSEALACLDRPGAVVIGGGTKVNAARPAGPVVVVDLQALPTGAVERDGADGLLIGATVTLQRLADDARVPAAIREAARREQPSTLRAMATVGGCVATADPSSELLAALLVHGGTVRLAGRDGEHDRSLAALLADRSPLAGRIITAVAVETGGVTAAARTARTPADRPIVAAVARRRPDGQRRLALTGVAAAPVLVTAERDAAGDLDPPGDFRGSSEYRRAIAAVLTRRVLGEIG
ncbi:MAG TPA: FAD binding domain-containing protein [Streptosporangiaceae bacterium]|nr:FAD binding domain-containing protein [Streptosporangiaceae bacterium]